NALVAAGRPAATRDLWTQQFGSWAPAARVAALNAARSTFSSLADAALAAHRGLITAEQRELDTWLRARAEALCGRVVQVQTDLFGNAPRLPRWQTLDEPAARLAAYATDGANAPASRREADGVLRLYEKRHKDLAARADARVLDPIPLGLLMLVPSGSTGGVR
ncbi:MAG: hypothetical protein KC766_11885, partial [Myxococcales bacterium]|nr:hypothetical protein [Myxococcales bacterium]